MIKFFLVALLCFVSICANAQPIIDIGQNDHVSEAPVVKGKSGSIEDAKDSRGIFSFMNFSFGKNKPLKEIDSGETTIERLKRESEEGNVDSQIMLGYIYLYGDGDIVANYEEAFRYYFLAAEQNDKIAVNNLGSLYYSGIGTERNTLKAAQMFDKAVTLGNNEAAINLAFIYLTGMGLNKDFSKAIQYFEIASDSGNPTAQFMLGYAYYKGFVVKQDLRKAFALVKDAATSKYDDAQYVLAKMYLNGEGTSKNYGNAVNFLTMSANQGNIRAMTDLGDILADGIFYTKNLYKAHILYNVASVYGAPNAANKRDIIDKALKIEELLQAQSEAEAFVAKPSELTQYIKDTFGSDVRSYIDDGMSAAKKYKNF